MTSTKILIGQVLIVLAIVIAGIWIATQWAAMQLAYQPELGAPWFVAFGKPIYHPWSIFPWWFSFDAYAPIIFDEAGAIAAAGGFIGCGAAIFGSVWRARQSSSLTTYGSARWATRKDIKDAGLLDQRGVALGRIRIAAEGERLLLSEKPIVHSPETTTSWRNQEIQPQAIGQFIWLIPWFCSVYCRDGERDDGIFRNTIKIPSPRGGCQCTPGDVGGRWVSQKPTFSAIFWTALDAAG